MRTYGIEIEHYTEYGECFWGISGAVTRLEELLGDSWELKSDCSLGRGGVEIITTHDKRITVHELRELVSALPFEEYGARVDERCGLHIHVSYEDFLPTNTYKLYKEVNTNDSQVLKDFYGRWDANYARPVRLGIRPTTAGLKRRINEKFQMLAQRCFGTLEFRMFAGTVDKNLIMQRITFVDKIADYLTFGNGKLDLSKLAQSIMEGNYVPCHSSVDKQ